MKLEQQVCSLELAKKLEKLGVKQKSLFWWGKEDGEFQLYFDFGKLTVKELEISGVSEIHSAFTVAELGSLLYEYNGKQIMQAYGHIFSVEGTSVITPLGLQELLRNPDLVAKMLIYLLEKGLIKKEQI